MIELQLEVAAHEAIFSWGLCPRAPDVGDTLEKKQVELAGFHT